jgi:phosphoglycerate dehydrogenase-like enzyme
VKDVTVWVVSKPGDEGLPVLAPAPPGVRFVVGLEPNDFAGAPAPDAIVSFSLGWKVLGPVWKLAPGVRWFHSRSAGLDGVLSPELQQADVVVTNGRGVFSRSLGEFVLAGVLYFAKDLRRMRRSQAAGKWDPFYVEEIAGRTMTIVGYGDIGRAAAAPARALGMKVVGLRRRASASGVGDDLAHEVWPMSELVAQCARADYLVVALPATPGTQAMVSAEALAALPKHAVVVNVGRGAVIDEPALIDALRSGRIRGAALDVFAQEPLPAGHPFYELDNVLLSPHCADNVDGWLQNASRFFLENLERFRRGEPLRNVADKAQGY